MQSCTQSRSPTDLGLRLHLSLTLTYSPYPCPYPRPHPRPHPRPCPQLPLTLILSPCHLHLCKQDVCSHRSSRPSAAIPAETRAQLLAYHPGVQSALSAGDGPSRPQMSCAIASRLSAPSASRGPSLSGPLAHSYMYMCIYMYMYMYMYMSCCCHVVVRCTSKHALCMHCVSRACRRGHPCDRAVRAPALG